MPRSARLVLPGLPFHVTQRGVNRVSIFHDEEDRQAYCRLLREATKEHGVAVHAYVLMGNHTHLLMTPSRVDSLARAMKRCGQIYSQAFNKRHGRSGALVQGRFHSSPVESERYFMEVLRYIELNPVRAAMVDDPVRHPWSSVHVHLGQRTDPLVDIHPQYFRLGSTPRERAETYAEWLRAGVPDDRLMAIRTHLQQGRALGGAMFQQSVAAALGRPAACRPRGRPRKEPEKTACAALDAQTVGKSLLTGNVPF